MGWRSLLRRNDDFFEYRSNNHRNDFGFVELEVNACHNIGGIVAGDSYLVRTADRKAGRDGDAAAVARFRQRVGDRP